MSINDAGKNIMLDALDIDTLSLHTGDPGVAGTDNEVSGGSPAYARKAVTWDAADAANLSHSNTPEFDVPASTTVTHIGYWATSTFRGSKAVTNEAFAAQGKYRVTEADISLTDPA